MSPHDLCAGAMPPGEIPPDVTPSALPLIGQRHPASAP